jgi:pullulanase
LKTKNIAVFTYVQQLIQLRKAHPAFRLQTAAQIKDNILFFDTLPGIIGYQLNGVTVKDSWKEIQVWFNGNGEEKEIPALKMSGLKTAIVNNIFVTSYSLEKLVLKPYSCIVLYRE